MQIGENAIWGRGRDEDGVSSYLRRLGVGARTPSPSTALMNYVTVFTSSCLSAPTRVRDITSLFWFQSTIIFLFMFSYGTLVWPDPAYLFMVACYFFLRVRLSPLNWVCRFFFSKGFQTTLRFLHELSLVRGRAVNVIRTGATAFCPFSTGSLSNRNVMSISIHIPEVRTVQNIVTTVL